VNGTLIVEHGGATNGFTARLTTVPERGFAIAILTNHAAGVAAHTEIARVALERLLGIRDVLPPTIALPDDALARFAGKYSHRLGDVTLSVRDGGYDVTRVNRNPFSLAETVGDPFRLEPVAERVFLASGGGTDRSYADVIQNDDGSVRFLRIGGRLGYPVASSLYAVQTASIPALGLEKLDPAGKRLGRQLNDECQDFIVVQTFDDAIGEDRCVDHRRRDDHVVDHDGHRLVNVRLGELLKLGGGVFADPERDD